MIGDKIKKRREELRLSQYELAKRMGYKSRSSLRINSETMTFWLFTIEASRYDFVSNPQFKTFWLFFFFNCFPFYFCIHLVDCHTKNIS